jgi:hypothetical protein
MHAHQGVRPLDVFRARCRIVAVEIWVRGAVYGGFPVDKLSEIRGELLVGAVAAGPERVPAGGGDSVVVQVGYRFEEGLVGGMEGEGRAGEEGLTPAGCFSCTRSLCHLLAPPGLRKLGFTSVAWRAGQMTLTPGTPGTCGA